MAIFCQKLTVILFVLNSCVESAPPPGYYGKSIAHVEEVSKEKRSTTEFRTFHVQYDDTSLELNLIPSVGLLPKALKVTAYGTDENGEQTVEDWTHMTGEGNEVYVDVVNDVSVLIDDMNGLPKLSGRVGREIIIEPQEQESANHTVSHVVYHVNSKVYPTGASQNVEIPEVVKEISSRQKRQQISQIYVPLYIVVNYEYYVMMGSNVPAAVAYIKTFWASVNSFFGLIPSPRAHISIAGIQIYKTKAEASAIEKHRHGSGGLIAGQVLDEYRKWAYNNRNSLGGAAGVYIMTGTKYMCTVPHGNSKELCKDIGGLTVESAACSGYGKPFPGITYRVAISLDDYAYSGVPAAVHEVGHMLGISHDGSKPNYDKNAPSAVTCPWTKFNIMGQPTYVKAHNSWSTCSVRQLQYWVQQSGNSGCVRSPPASSPYPFDVNTLTVHSANRQCQLRHGQSSTFPSWCQGATTKNDEICYKMLCHNKATNKCEYGYGAAPGTPCGPGGEICYGGACQIRPGSGSGQPSGNTGQGNCVDKPITLAGQTCGVWLAGNLGACNHETITSNCCASRARLCGGSAPQPTRSSISSGGTCVDSPGVAIGGQSCSQYLSVAGRSYACDWPVVKQYCCASRAQYCANGNNGIVG